MSISKQAKEIANQVIHSQKAQTFRVNEGDDKSIDSLIYALNKHKVEAELVTIEGNIKGIYVSPNWDSLLDSKTARQTKIELEALVDENPFTLGIRTLETPDSSAISKILWENETLTVHFKSNSHVPYTYPNVPEREFDTLLEIHNKGESVGSYVTRHIKKNYSVELTAKMA